MTSDGYNTLTYDAANHLVTAGNGSSSGAYSYDGNGLRVKKSVPSTSPTTTTVYIFSGGKVLAEYDNNPGVTSPTREYIYSGGAMIAKIAGGTTTYYHGDHLSNRIVTNSSGSVIEQLGHFPFGETWYDTGSEKHKFTMYERDTETGNGGGAGNDYALARYDVNRLGRFSQPDPLNGSTANPQSLNHYTYAGNDPINLGDPTGMDEAIEAPDPDLFGCGLEGRPNGEEGPGFGCNAPGGGGDGGNGFLGGFGDGEGGELALENIDYCEVLNEGCPNNEPPDKDSPCH